MIELQDCTGPEEIERRSFAMIDAEIGAEKPFPPQVWEVARRLVHTTGDFAILDSLYLPPAAVEAGIAAIRNGAVVYTDTEMAKAGMSPSRLRPFGVRVECLLTQPDVARLAQSTGDTRSKVAVEMAADKLDGAIVAIGNAPTALLALLKCLDRPQVLPPSLVIGMPVGFVNAAEAKELLIRNSRVQSLVIRGRRGGSPFVAAVVNALAALARE